jgi:hypothetical protein
VENPIIQEDVRIFVYKLRFAPVKPFSSGHLGALKI